MDQTPQAARIATVKQKREAPAPSESPREGVLVVPKGKTHKGLAKRVKVTGTGKLMRKQAGAGHLMSAKAGKRRRQLRRDRPVSKTLTRRLSPLLNR